MSEEAGEGQSADTGGSGAVRVTEEVLPSTAELRGMFDQALIRLENWKLEVERNPNPRMVHVLKNILAHIESLSRLNESRTQYSYKHLSRQMAMLMRQVADLNVAITDALVDDDAVDADEEVRINEGLRAVVGAAVELLRIVQQRFSVSRRIGSAQRSLPDHDSGNESRG